VLIYIIKLENRRNLKMEKTKYIVSRLAIIAIATAVILASVRGLIYIANTYGFEAQQVVTGFGIAACFGMLVWWLSESYELNKLKNIRKD
jgi:hypothetical protein